MDKSIKLVKEKCNTNFFHYLCTMFQRLVAPLWKWWYKHHPTPSRFTKDEALQIARKYKLEEEVIMAMKNGCNPDEALQDWDIYPYNNK